MALDEELFSPRPKKEAEFSPAPRLTSLEGVTVGLLDNYKANAERFLGFVGKLLQERHGVAELVPMGKEALSKPAPAELIAGLAARSHLIVTGIGD
ncbi:MAG: hypothetical protein GEV03_04095 [Streptosporangiales bacterium]|nr:hypothetical protein [Streptosporangiales bacterium]